MIGTSVRPNRKSRFAKEASEDEPECFALKKDEQLGRIGQSYGNWQLSDDNPISTVHIW